MMRFILTVTIYQITVQYMSSADARDDPLLTALLRMPSCMYVDDTGSHILTIWIL